MIDANTVHCCTYFLLGMPIQFIDVHTSSVDEGGLIMWYVDEVRLFMCSMLMKLD